MFPSPLPVCGGFALTPTSESVPDEEEVKRSVLSPLRPALLFPQPNNTILGQHVIGKEDETGEQQPRRARKEGQEGQHPDQVPRVKGGRKEQRRRNGRTEDARKKWMMLFD